MSEYQALLRCGGCLRPILLLYTPSYKLRPINPSGPRATGKKTPCVPTCKRVYAYTEQSVH
jgi:hypothetical protein